MKIENYEDRNIRWELQPVYCGSRFCRDQSPPAVRPPGDVHKPDMPSAEERVRAIAELYKDEPAIEVKPYYGLAVDFAKAENAHFIVKGVRSVKDFEYEREQADINRELSGVETILLYSEPQYSSISSSMVRELQHFGVDVTQYLPKR